MKDENYNEYERFQELQIFFYTYNIFYIFTASKNENNTFEHI